MMSKTDLFFIVGVFTATSALPACSRTDQRIPDVATIQPQELYQPFVGGAGLPEKLVDRPPYRLTPGDVLTILPAVSGG